MTSISLFRDNSHHFYLYQINKYNMLSIDFLTIFVQKSFLDNLYK